MSPRSLPALLAAAALLLSTPARAQQWLQDCGDPASPGILPIGYPGSPGFAWKEPLYQWMSQFGDADFDWVQPPKFIDPGDVYGATGPGCSTNPVWQGLGAPERTQIEQYWLLVQGDFPVPMAWFTYDPHLFTVEAMEEENTCEALLPDLAWGDGLAFFANWQYPGNPFGPGTGNDLVLKRRLAVWLGAQLILLDRGHYDTQPPYTPAWTGLHDHPLQGSGAAAVGSELAAVLGELAWTYLNIEDTLAPNEQVWFETALEMYAERVDYWGAFNQHSNRGIRATHALYYAWAATGSSDVWVWYQDSLVQFFDASGGNWVPGGYWRDDRGMDLNYGGSNLMSAVRTMQIDTSGVPQFVTDAVSDAFELNAHLTVPDVDGRWLSPNVFNSRTSQGPTWMLAPYAYQSYYGAFNRFLPALDLRLPWAEAYMRDQPGIGTRTPYYNVQSANFHGHLGCDSQYAQYINPQLLGQLAAPDPWPPLWESQDWGVPLSTLENHDVSLWPSWWADVQQSQGTGMSHNDNLELMPTELHGPYLRNFADKFIFAKYGQPGLGLEYSASLHVGEIGFLNSGAESGWGGGQLVNLWAPDGGSFVLGRRMGVNNPPFDDWAQWRRFPWHTVTLRTDDDRIATSARIFTPTTQVFLLAQEPPAASIPAALAGVGAWGAPPTVPEDVATSAIVHVRGQIGPDGRQESNGAPMWTGVLNSPVDYHRSFVFTKTSLFVRTEVGAGGAGDLLTEAWETLPIWNRGVVDQATMLDATIRLRSLTQGWVTATTGTNGIVPMVQDIIVVRNGRQMKIRLDQPRGVRVDGVWQHGQLQSRTLLVNLLPAGCGAACVLQPTRLTWQIDM